MHKNSLVIHVTLAHLLPLQEALNNATALGYTLRNLVEISWCGMMFHCGYDDKVNKYIVLQKTDNGWMNLIQVNEKWGIFTELFTELVG